MIERILSTVGKLARQIRVLSGRTVVFVASSSHSRSANRAINFNRVTGLGEGQPACRRPPIGARLPFNPSPHHHALLHCRQTPLSPVLIPPKTAGNHIISHNRLQLNILCLSGCLPCDLPRIAQHFSAGFAGEKRPSPGRTAEKSFRPCRDLRLRGEWFPALKRWAIFKKSICAQVGNQPDKHRIFRPMFDWLLLKFHPMWRGASGFGGGFAGHLPTSRATETASR